MPRSILALSSIALLASSVALGCSNDEAAGDGDSGGVGGDRGSTGGGSATGGSNTTAPPPGPSADGWEKAYGEGSAGCGEDEAAFAELPQLTVGDTTLYVGFEQTSGNNQDPVVARFDAGEKIWCKYHEDDGPDGRALGITWDGGDHAYVVYSVVGGGTDLEGQDGWLSSYSAGRFSGGGVKVSYVGRVNVATGDLESGTFVIAVTEDNKVNSHNSKDAVTVLADGTVEFLGESAHKAIDADGESAMDCTDYPFDSRYRFSSDLSTLVCADCTNCVAQQPCE